MSQTNINTNNGQNRNQNSERGEQGQGGSRGGGRGYCCNNCGNKMIAKYTFEGKMKDSPISKLLIPKLGIDPLNLKRLLTLFPYYA